MLRRFSILLLSLLGLCVLLSAPAEAQVAGTCVLHAPSRVAIGRPYIGLRLTMSGPCYPGGYASWWLYHPSQGAQDVAIFDNTTSEYWDVYSDHTIGVHTWRPGYAWDAGYVDQAQNAPISTVKLAAGAWTSSSRSGDVVTLKGTSLLYSVSNNNYFKRSAGGVFQFRERGTTQWKNLKSVWTNSRGEATMAYRYSKTRDYRFALYSTSISWDLGSAVTTR
jgi:hypothetical protein